MSVTCRNGEAKRFTEAIASIFKELKGLLKT